MLGSKKIKVLISSLMLVLLASCGEGSNQYMKGVSVNTHDVDGDTYVSVDAKIEMQNLMLAEIMVPIYRDGSQIGTVHLGQDIIGGNHVEIDINMSEILGVGGVGLHRLPNGVAIPLIGSNPSISIRAGKGIEIYLIKTEDVLGLAVSLNIKEFDGMGRSIGTAGIFPMFNVDNVVGAAGIYTSLTPGKNGIALAFDLSAYLPEEEMGALRSGMLLDKAGSVSLDYGVAEVGSSKQKKKLARKMYKLNRKAKKLHVRD